VKEHSIGFNVKGQKKGKEANELLDVVLYEGSSLTSWGANQYTPMLGLKGITMESRIDRLYKLQKFVKNSDATDETIDLLMLEIKQLNQLIEDLKSEQESAEPQPVEPKADPVQVAKDAMDILLFKNFNN
jgi:hypothetical protein